MNPTDRTFASGLKWDLGTTVPVEAQQRVASAAATKQANLDEASILKQAIFGGPDTQRVIATAVDQGNRLGQDPSLEDLALPFGEFADRYGDEAARNRFRFDQARRELDSLKNRERSTGGVVRDTLIDTGLAAANVVGGAVALGTNLTDQLLDTNVSQRVSQGLENLNEFGRENQTQLRQDRGAQHALEADLDREDREARFEERVARNQDNPSDWDRVILPRIQKLGEAFGETVTNFGDDPIMMGSLIPEGVGSLIPATGAIRAIAIARTVRALEAGGMASSAARAHLRTAAGRELVERQAVSAAPLVSGAMEGGSAVNQAQMQILSMTEDDLDDNPQYQALRQQGLSHEEAQTVQARNAGTAAGVAALPGAILAGSVSAPFAANPLSLGRGTGSAAVRAGRNVVSEGVEETLQEASSQLATNIGVNAVGENVALDEGVGESAAQGLLGGIAAAGALQTPGLAARATTDVVRAGVTGAVTGGRAAIVARQNQLNRRADADSVVGTTAQEASAERMRAAGQELISGLPAEAPVANTVAETRAETSNSSLDPSGVRARILEGLFLKQEEVAGNLEIYPELGLVQEASPDGSIPRSAAIRAAGKILSDAGSSEPAKISAALGVLEDFDSMRGIDSTAMQEAISEISQTDPDQASRFRALAEEIQVLESDPVIIRARKSLQSLTPEKTRALLQLDQLKNENVDPEFKTAVAKALETIGRVNPEAVGLEDYDLVLDQVDGETQRRLKLARDVSAWIQNNAEEKAKIKQNTGHQTSDIVHNNITVQGNFKNKMPSLESHRLAVSEAARVGRIEEAQDALEDLRNFGISQINKVNALNQSAQIAPGKDAGVPFTAFGPNGFFEQNAVFVNTRSPGSLGSALEVAADTALVANLANALAETFNLGGPVLEVPNLDNKILEAAGLPTNQTTSPQSEPDGSEDTLSEAERSEEVSGGSDRELDQQDQVSDQDDRPPLVLVSPSNKVETRAAKKELKELKRVVNAMIREARSAWNSDSRAKRPLVAELIKLGMRVDPRGKVGQELRSKDVNSRNAPGLFKNAGRTNLDNLVQSEWENSFPGITTATGSQFDPDGDLKGFLNEDGLIDLIADEVHGRNAWLDSRRLAEDIQAEIGSVEREIDKVEKTLEDLEIERNTGIAPQGETQDGEQQDAVGSTEGSQGEAGNVDDPGQEPQGSDLDPEENPGDAADAEGTTGTNDEEVSEEELNEESRPEEPEPVRRWFDRLSEILPKTAEGINIFLNAFHPRDGRSTLTAHENPIDWLRENLSSLVRDGEALRRELTDEEQEALADVLENSFPDFRDEFMKRMNTLIQKRGWGEDLGLALTYPNAYPLNFIVGQDTDTQEAWIDEPVMAATFMSVFEWMLANSGARRRMDDDDINKMFQQPRGSYVTDEMRQAARHGPQLQSALEQISTKMETLLGVSPKSDIAVKQTQGLFRSMASNALSIMIDSKLIETKDVSIKVAGSDGDGVRARKTLRVTDPFREDEVVKVLVKLRDPFTQIFTDGQRRERFIGEAPKRVANTQLGNRLARLSSKERKALKRLQNIPSYANVPMVDFVEALGSNVYKNLLGYRKVDDALRKRTNVSDLESIEGKNNTLDHGLEQSFGYIEEARLLAPDIGEDLDEVQIFHSWNVSAVGRAQQQGPITPQGDKIARELISATRATINLGDTKHQKALWLAVAQSVDISIEKQSHKVSIRKARAMMTDPKKLGSAVNLVKDWLRTGELSKVEFQKALEASGETVTPKLIHAVVTVARAEEAQRAGGENASQFRTSLALEADGKTDGPVNAMIHMGVGRFSPEEIERYAKGGLYFTKRTMSLNQFIEEEHGRFGNSKKRAEDLYHLAASRLQDKLTQRLSLEANDTEKVLSTLRVLDAFLPDFRLGVPDVDGKYRPEIDRGITKNPLTVFLYGSGVRGISGKVSGIVAEQLSKTLSEIAGGIVDGRFKSWQDHPLFVENPGLVDDLADLLVPVTGGRAMMRKWFSDPVNAKISGREFEAMRETVLKHFAEPMAEAVDEATGGLATNMKLTQQASQVQSLIFKDVFTRRLEEASKTSVGLLSREAVEDIFIEVMKIAPIYGTDAQSFHISAPTPDRVEHVVGESMSGTLGARATYITPSEASVKASPFMTIGTGDGRMILNIYSDGNGVFDVSLPVFDGVEMSISTIDEASGQINRATYDAWMNGNIYQSVAEGYAQLTAWMDKAKFAQLSLSTRNQLRRTMALKGNQIPSLAHVRDIETTLKKLSRQSAARKAAMRRMATQTDHMASAEAPHAQEGVSTTNDDPLAYEEITETLNRFYDEELQSEASQTKEPAVQKPTKELQDLIAQSGETIQEHPGVRRLTGEQLLSSLNNMPGVTPEQARTFRSLLSKSDQIKNTLYFFGTSPELEALRDNLYSEFPKKPIQLGQTHVGAGVVFVSNAAPETVLHEMLHTVTGKILTDHYRNPENSPQHVRISVARLEELLSDVMELVPDTEALKTLQDQVNRLERRPDGQISELISYMLSNQNLIEKGQSLKTFRTLTSIVKKGLAVLKQLLGIRDQSGDTLFSNIRFNTEVLLMEDPTVEAARADADVDAILEQVYGPQGNNPDINESDDLRLQRLERRFMTRLRRVLEASKTKTAPERILDQGEVSRELNRGREAAELAVSQGYDLNPRQARTFEAIHAAMMSSMKLDPNLMRQANDAYVHVIRSLRSDDFPSVNRGPLQKEFLVGVAGIRKNSEGQSDLLASFMALALVDPELREILSRTKPHKAVALKWNSVDNFLTSLANTALALLTRLSIGNLRKGRALNVRSELDHLADTLTEIQGQRRLMAAVETYQEKVNQVEEFISNKIQGASERVTNRLDDISQRNSGVNNPNPTLGNRVLKTSVDVAGFVTALGSGKASAIKGEALTKMLNHAPGASHLRALLSELRGVTDTNRSLMRMVNPVKAQSDALRQDFREGVPEELKKNFSRELTREEYSQMLTGMARTDLLVLGRAGALALMKDPSRLGNLIRQEELELGKHTTPQLMTRYQAKARALAIWMVRREVTSENLLRNAHAIAHLFNEGNRPDQARITDDLVASIDRLTSLYAYQELDQGTRDKLVELTDTQLAGMEIVTGLLASTRAMEIERRDRKGGVNETARNNGWKGHVPELIREGSSVIVADDIDQEELTRKGFVRIGDYRGDARENRKGLSKRGYYQSTVSGRGSFRQGVAQTVHETWQGVDALTGRTLPGQTAGMVLGKSAQRASRSATQAVPGSLDGLAPGEYLLPLVDAQGQVTAYERSMAPEKLVGLQKDTHLGRMLGVWAGRIIEEDVANKFNREFVEVLKEIHDKAVVVGQEDQFVNVADPEHEDSVIRDAWNTMGWQIRQDAAEIFGRVDYLPVRREMVDNAIGYRRASVTDPWSGISRWSPENQTRMKEVGELILGREAFRKMRQGENLVHDAVSYAKTTIIVRSVVVAWQNLMSNGLHLSLLGVGMVTIAKGSVEKFGEITEYVKNRGRIQQLQVSLAAVIREPAKAALIRAEINALEDANGRLSIKPLIDAGEFSTISENLTEADVAIREGRWVDFMEKATDKLPGWAGTAAKNLLITKDTALFQGLNRMVQYGDFVAKAVLYDHLTQKKGLSKREALDQIFEEFVAYNLLPGRGRDFLESMGLMWFWNYKIRIMKVLTKTMRERPLSSLLLMGQGGPTIGVDSIWDGSLLGNAVDGSLEYSISPEMGFNAPAMNPFWAVTN